MYNKSQRYMCNLDSHWRYVTLRNFTHILWKCLSFSHSSPSHRNVAAISPAPLQWTTTCKKTHGDGENQDRRPNLYWIWGLNLKAPQKHHMSKALAASNDESNLSFQMFIGRVAGWPLGIHFSMKNYIWQLLEKQWNYGKNTRLLCKYMKNNLLYWSILSNR